MYLSKQKQCQYLPLLHKLNKTITAVFGKYQTTMPDLLRLEQLHFLFSNSTTAWHSGKKGFRERLYKGRDIRDTHDRK